MAADEHGRGDVVAAAAHLAELARELADEDDPASVVQSVVEAAAREVPGAEYAGVTVIDRKGARTPAATDDLVGRVDTLQYRFRQGPCLEAADRSRTIRTDDLTDEGRWPDFRVAAAGYGVRSVLSFPLFVESGTIGALNLYSSSPGAFGLDSERIGYLLAAHAAAAIVTTRQNAGLVIALDNRDIIGQAKGILMERYKITSGRAFALLTAASQHTNVKLHEIARHLTDTGELATPRSEDAG